MRIGTFPFGEPIKTLGQKDRRHKEVFVLGVYASAVHAHWRVRNGRTLINAVAVASEPEIFWNGEGADEIIKSVTLPEGAGQLDAPRGNLNGPSGCALDNKFLRPLMRSRDEAWLCDLVPHSCMNPKQRAALARIYDKLAAKLMLPAYDWPPVPKTLASESRRKEIEAEVSAASPEVLVTLGDQPLQWFAKQFGAATELSAYGETVDHYGRLHDITIAGRKMKLLPLVHPRQAAGLGFHSAKWAALHKRWMEKVAPSLIR